MRTVFYRGEDGRRYAVKVRDNRAAYAFAGRKRREGADYAVVADPARKKYEEARIDGDEIVWRKVSAPDFGSLCVVKEVGGR